MRILFIGGPVDGQLKDVPHDPGPTFDVFDYTPGSLFGFSPEDCQPLTRKLTYRWTRETRNGARVYALEGGDIMRSEDRIDTRRFAVTAFILAGERSRFKISVFGVAVSETVIEGSPRHIADELRRLADWFSRVRLFPPQFSSAERQAIRRLADHLILRVNEEVRFEDNSQSKRARQLAALSAELRSIALEGD